MSKKREAEREAWKERKQALNDIQKQNDDAYAQRIVNLNEHPLLQGITNTKEYRKISKQLQKAALTQDIWADGFTLENKSVVQNNTVQQEQPVVQQQTVQQDVAPMEFSGPISIKIGDSKITVNSKEEADKLLEELAKSTPVYDKDRYEASLNDLKSILYTGKGNTKMHSGLMANLSGLSRLQAPTSSVSSSTVKSDSDVSNSETDKTPTLWGNIIQIGYNGKYNPEQMASGIDPYKYKHRLGIYRQAVRMLDNNIDTSNMSEEDLDMLSAQRGWDLSNVKWWMQLASDYGVEEEGEKKQVHPYKIEFDQSGLYDGFQTVEGYEELFNGFNYIDEQGNELRHDGIVLQYNPQEGKYYITSKQLNPETGKYDTQIDVNRPVYDNGYFLYKDDEGSYHFGKVGEEGFTEQDNKYLSEYIDNTWRAPYRINQYDPTKSNYILDQIISKDNTNKYYQDITPVIKGIPSSVRVIVTNPETIGIGGTYKQTPIFFINEKGEIEKGLATSTENGNLKVEFISSDGSVSSAKEFITTKGDKNYTSDILNKYNYKYPYKNKQLRPELIKNPEITAGQLYDNGRFEKGANAQSAKSNNPEHYLDDDKVKNIVNSVLFDIPEDSDNEHMLRYMYFALRVVEMKGGEFALRRLGIDEQQIANFYYKIFKYIYGDQVPVNKHGGILKAQNGIDTSSFKKITESEDQPKYTYKPLPKPQDDGRKTSEEMSAVDWITLGFDTASVATAYIPVYGPAASVALGLIATAVQGVSDLTDGEQDGAFWKNLGINLGFTVLGAIPGLNSSKLVKGGKQASKVFDDVIKGCDAALQGVESGSKAAEEINKIRKAAEASIEQLKPNNLKQNLATVGSKLGDLVESSPVASTVVKGLDYTTKLGAATIGGISAYNAIDDAVKGKEFNWDNARGMLGIAGLGANYLNNKRWKTFNSKVTSKEIPNSTSNGNTLNVRVGKADDFVEVEIPVQQNMSDSDIEHKAINKLTDEVLKSKEKSKLELERKENRTPDEQAELNSLNRQIEKINNILKERTIGERIVRWNKVKYEYDKNQLKESKDKNISEVQMLKRDVDNGLNWVQKQYINMAEKFGFKREDSEEGKQIIEMLEFLKNPNKFKNTTGKSQSSQISTPVVTQTSTPVSAPISSSQHSVNYGQYFKKGGQLYNSNEVNSLINLKKKDITKYQTPAGPITIGNQKQTNQNFYDTYNQDILQLFTKLTLEGKLTQELVDKYNTLFTDKQSLDNWAVQNNYDGSKALVDNSGNVQKYQEDFNILGGHTDNFITGWEKDYINDKLISSENFNENGKFKSDKNYGGITKARNMNFMTKDEVLARNNAIKNSGFKFTLMSDSPEADENGRQYYNIIPLNNTQSAPFDNQVSKNPLSNTPSNDGNKTEVNLEEDENKITLTPEKPEYSRSRGFSWAPLKAGTDLFLDNQANKRILEASYQDAPPKESYVDGYKKVTDNYVSRWLAKKNAGDLNVQSAFLANNIADIDKANAVQLQGWKQGLDATYDAAMKTYDEYKRTSAEQEELRRKYDLQNHEIKYKNDMQQYQNNLINKNRFVQFLNANKQSQQAARNWLDSRLIEETKAYTDLYNRDLMAGAEMNKSNALTMAMNDYYTNVGLANDVDKEFAEYLKTWKEDTNNAADLAAGNLPTMDSPIGETGETYNEKKARLQREAQIKYQNAIQIAEADYQAASNYTMPYINQYYNWIPNFYRHYMYPGIDKKAQGGTLNFKEKKELLRLKNGYQQLRETVKDIQKSIDNGERQLERISSGLSKERLLLLKNMLK